jgi:hypothetical protein
MKRDVVVAGLLGAVVMFTWLFISNAMIPYKSSLIHRQLPVDAQLEIHLALKSNITENGTYSVPYLPNEEQEAIANYRSQPVYSITYQGVTHGEGSPMTLTPFFVALVVPMLAAWMLSVTTDRIRSVYLFRVLFVVAIGVIIALFDDVLQMSFGPQPRDYLTFLALNHLVCWTLLGLVIAWRLKPRTT